MRKLLGIWAEEIDALNDGEYRQLSGVPGNNAGLKGPYQAHHLCELIHTETAQSLAIYDDDFYAGRPAATINHFGKGKAWYIASRNDLAFQRDFFTALISELALTRAVEERFPTGVVATARTDGTHAFIFIQNYTACTQFVTLPSGYSDALSLAAIREVTLRPWDCRVIRRRA